MHHSLEKVATWSKIVGYVYLIAGILGAVFGLFAFIIGAVPGIIEAYLGYLLIQSSKAVKQYQSDQDESSLSVYFDKLGTFFKLQGILIIIGLALGLIGMAIGGIGFIAMLSELSNY